MSEQDIQNQQHRLMGAIRRFGGDMADIPFWEACEDGRFLLHRCNRCGCHYWPASRCVEHGDEDMQWVEACGRGRVYTYTVMHRAYTAQQKDQVPFAIAVVQLEEGPFFHSNILDCACDAVTVDMAVEVVLVAHESGLTIPQFRPAVDAGGNN
jgi:uncharacterized OB-fold protein